jgi:predicted nucleic acid-binding protein
MPFISDSSTLIALTQIGQLDLLETVSSTVLVPPAVVRETARSVTLPPWIRQQPLTRSLDRRIVAARLGPGESETIGLGLELPGSTMVLDDQPARVLASALGLPVVGTLGILLDCKRRGDIPHVKPLIDELMTFDFYISPAVYAHVLTLAGEI